MKLDRLPIRLRLTLAFAAVMAVVLAAIGLFLYFRLGTEFDATVNKGLRSRATDVAALVRQADSGLAEAGRSPLTEQGENLAQILTASGRVLDPPAALRDRPLLNRAEVRRALRGLTLIEHPPAPGEEEPTRLLATLVRAQGQRLVVVVGASLEDRYDAQHNLGALLALGGPVALLVASLAGYGVAAAALRPVELMRRRAAEIQVAEAGQRLPVAPVRDELSRLGVTLNDMLARLEASFARERTFVSDASHELRTPLAILRTELELAQSRDRSKAELQTALRSASAETERLVQLAEDLLVEARSDRGRLPIRAEDVRADEILQRVRDRFGQRAQEAGTELEVAEGSGLALRADPLRLEQALGNLVDNALRHGGGGVSLCATTERGRVALHVCDAGPGFPEPFLPSAFERFTRGDPARPRGGTGLGLAIVAAIAAAHGGEAGARNRPEGGADAWVAIPPGDG